MNVASRLLRSSKILLQNGAILRNTLRFGLNYLRFCLGVLRRSIAFALLVFLLAPHRHVTERGAFGFPAWMLPVIGFLFMALVMPLTTMLNVYSMRRRNPSLGNQTWVLTPEQYSVSGALFNTVFKWDAFPLRRVRRKAYFTVLFIALGTVHPEISGRLGRRAACGPVAHPTEAWFQSTLET